jgi:hypothetical protein
MSQIYLPHRRKHHAIGGEGYIGLVQEDSPMYFYMFDELSGNAINYGTRSEVAVANGGPTYDQAGIITGYNCARHEPSTSNYYKAGHASDVVTGRQSLELWFSHDNAANERIFYWQNSTYLVRITTTSGGAIAVQFMWNGVYQINHTIASYSFNTPHHLVMVFGQDGGLAKEVWFDNVKVYDVDGIASDFTTMGFFNVGTKPHVFGGGPLTTNKSWDGLLAGFAWYPTYLTASRIDAHYVAGTA